MADLVFMTVKDIAREYGLSESTVRELLHVRVNPCPLVRGRNGKRFLVEKGVFEEWVRGLGHGPDAARMGEYTGVKPRKKI